MKNMKKILFGLGSVTAVVAPVAAAVACGSPTKGWKNGYTVKSVYQFESALTDSVKDADKTFKNTSDLFKFIGGVDGTDLLLDVYQSSNDYAIIVEGDSLIDEQAQLDATNTVAKLESDFGISAVDLAKGSYVILVKNGKVTVQDVIAKADETARGLSKDADTSFSVN